MGPKVRYCINRETWNERPRSFRFFLAKYLIKKTIAENEYFFLTILFVLLRIKKM